MSRPRVVTALALLLAVLRPPTAGSQSPDADAGTQPVPATLDEFRVEAAKILSETRIPGAGIALVRTGAIEWAGGLGLADRDAGTPVTADTHFRVGSITKTFVAMALVQQYEDGAMDLDTPVKDLAPLVAIDNPWEASDPVTVRHLLQHTAGFDDMHFNEMYNVTDPPDVPLADVLKKNPASRRVRWRPGTRMAYSNPGYGVAGYVLEQVTQQSYEEVIAERIFRPLGMSTSSFVLREADHARLARGYDRPDGPPVPNTQIYLRPAGNLHSSAAELGTFVRLLLNWGETETDLVIDPEYLSNMERPQTSIAARAGLLYGYGTGLASQTLAGYPVLGHGGGIEGFSSMFGYSTSRDAGYVVLLNGTYAPQALRRLTSLAIRYLKREVEPPPKPEATPGPEALRVLEGYYHVDGGRSQIFAGVEWLRSGQSVSASGNTLVAAPVFGRPQVLVPLSDNIFRRQEDVTPSRVFTTDDGRFVQTSADGFFLVRTPRWRVEIVRMPVLTSLALVGSVPLACLLWLVRVRAARPRGFWALKIALLAIPGSFVSLASMMLWAPQREWGTLNVWTALTFVGSCGVPIAGIAALVLTLDAWAKGAGPWLRLYALLVAVGSLLVTTFMASAGLVALRPWAY
jgi:CubicO group peptidase (beta-lactamase class C family)